VALVAWCGLFVVTHLPKAPQVTEFPGLDKLLHVAAFAGLALVCCWAVSSWRRLSPVVYAWIVGVLVIYAAVDELLQIPIPRRNADPLDWLADMAGAVCGAAVFALILRWIAARRKPVDLASDLGGCAEEPIATQ
jgi:VanZ family protein